MSYFFILCVIFTHYGTAKHYNGVSASIIGTFAPNMGASITLSKGLRAVIDG